MKMLGMLLLTSTLSLAPTAVQTLSFAPATAVECEEECALACPLPCPAPCDDECSLEAAAACRVEDAAKSKQVACAK
jgi:hypothetical protein